MGVIGPKSGRAVILPAVGQGRRMKIIHLLAARGLEGHKRAVSPGRRIIQERLCEVEAALALSVFRRQRAVAYFGFTRD